MYQFRAFPLMNQRLQLLAEVRKSHSAIPGSTVACAYPGLIAVCHDLHRLPSLAIHQLALTYRVLLMSPEWHFRTRHAQAIGDGALSTSPEGLVCTRPFH